MEGAWPQALLASPEFNTSVPVSPERVRTIYDGVMKNLTWLNMQVRVFMERMIDQGLVGQMKTALADDPPMVELLIMLEGIATGLTPPKRNKRKTAGEFASSSSAAGKKRAKLFGSSSSNEKQTPPKLGRTVSEILGSLTAKSKVTKLKIPKIEPSESGENHDGLLNPCSYESDSDCQITGEKKPAKNCTTPASA